MSRIEALKKEIEASKAITEKLQKELEREKKKTEIEFPFSKSDLCFVVDHEGEIFGCTFHNDYKDQQRCLQGNIFKTIQEAERERDKRELLTLFRQFRDKCNGDWKPDWNDIHEGRYYIHLYPNKGECSIGQDVFQDSMPQFGRFKNVDDCLLAIELFGDEIKRLYVEELEK